VSGNLMILQGEQKELNKVKAINQEQLKVIDNLKLFNAQCE